MNESEPEPQNYTVDELGRIAPLGTSQYITDARRIHRDSNFIDPHHALRTEFVPDWEVAVNGGERTTASISTHMDWDPGTMTLYFYERADHERSA